MGKEDKAATPDAPVSETAAVKESKKAPKPDGFVSPIEYAEHRSELLGKFIRPQTIYGLLRSAEASGFPVTKNTDGKWMIDQAAADAWYENKAVARAAKKAAKEAAAVATPEGGKEAVAS